ncbi:MAG: hypothetical protein K6F59_02805 [Gammaproteobacteria bacterium]|nr:hypothetical protein [Gammaproteobacteria bacterium]
MEQKKLVNISKKTFFSVLILLFVLMVLSVVLTYVIPKGAFGKLEDGSFDYSVYTRLENEKGIAIWKGFLAPFLILGTKDGINLIMLSIFLLVITGAFEAMSASNGIKVIVSRIINRFKNRRFLLLSIIALVFMLFGALLGLFEEMLTLLPIIVILCVSLGYDSFTGFIVSIVACGFGFSSAITNPFTVLFASKIIGVNPMANVWYRIIIFVVMYGLLELFIFLYTRKIKKNPEKSLTYENDQLERENVSYEEEHIENEKKIFITYLIFFAVVLSVIFSFSLIEAIRDYTVVALIVVFLFGGILSSLIATNWNAKLTFKSFLKGVLSALPTIAFVFMASSIKYILEEGHILPTIANSINKVVEGNNVYSVALVLFVIILGLEFFISSSTAKAIFVMSILAILNLGLTKEMQVLIYTFADGYTNLLFPTSPVLLIGLSMVGVSYFKWLKKSALLFIITFTLVIGFIMLGIAIGF